MQLIFTWLGSFKEFLFFCWSQVHGFEPWVLASYPRFAIVMSFPIHVKRKGGVVKRISRIRSSYFVHIIKSQTWTIHLVRLGTKLILLGFIINHAFPMRDSIPKVVMLGLNCIQAYPFTTILLETPRAIANFLFGVVFELYFDDPFMAISLVEFWARRWSLLVSNMPHDNLVFCLLKASEEKLMVCTNKTFI